MAAAEAETMQQAGPSNTDPPLKDAVNLIAKEYVEQMQTTAAAVKNRWIHLRRKAHMLCLDVSEACKATLSGQPKERPFGSMGGSVSCNFVGDVSINILPR